MAFAVKGPGMAFPKILNTIDALDELARMRAYHSESPDVVLYRVVDNPSGNIVLQKMRVIPGSGTDVTTTVNPDFEDDA